MMYRKISLIITLLITLSVRAIGPAHTPADTVACNRHRTAGAITLQVASSAAFNLGLTELLKHSIHEMRPDRTAHDSWPSRHTSWAFMAASSFSAEMYARSGWWVVGAHTLANAVAMQRCLAGRHFPKDVLGGAAVGLTSTGLGIVLSNLVFPDARPCNDFFAGHFAMSVDAVTRAVFYPAQKIGDTSLRTGVESVLRFTLPLHERWGVTAEASLLSTPYYKDSFYLDTAHGIGLGAGVVVNILQYGPWALEGRWMHGISRNISIEKLPSSRWSYITDLSAGGYYTLARTFALGAEASYGITTNRGPVSRLSFSLISRVRF